MVKYVYYKKLEWINIYLKREFYVIKVYFVYKNLK